MSLIMAEADKRIDPQSPDLTVVIISSRKTNKVTAHPQPLVFLLYITFAVGGLSAYSSICLTF